MDEPLSLEPTPAQLDMIRLAGLEPRDDGVGHLYRRWHLAGWPVGIVYSETMPLRWGVYWGANKTVDGMVWTRSLSTAMEVLEYLSRLM